MQKNVVQKNAHILLFQRRHINPINIDLQDKNVAKNISGKYFEIVHFVFLFVRQETLFLKSHYYLLNIGKILQHIANFTLLKNTNSQTYSLIHTHTHTHTQKKIQSTKYNGRS